jgi:hypothetical protein
VSRVSFGRDAPAWLVGAAGLAISVAIALRVLIPYGMDPTIFLALGEDAPIQTAYARELLGKVDVRPGGGHDGKYFFAQANDPWYLEPERNAVVLDRPAYRGQRMLFPVIAGGFGLFPPGVTVWAMLVTNLLAMAIGAMLAAKLAESWGGATWLGLLVPLNIGLLFELEIGGAGILAYACCLGALYALVIDRTWLASFLFAAAGLSREVMVLFAVGVFVLWWLERRELPWRLVIAPLVAMAVWYVYLHVRLAGIRGVGQGTENFAAPFLGIVEALRSWIRDPIELLYNLPLLAIVFVFVPIALRSRLPIAWGALPFVALATILSVNVWREPFDLSRAVAPLLTAVPFLIILPRRDVNFAPTDYVIEKPA